MNLLQDAAALGALTWEHEPRWELLTGGGVRVLAPPLADYFQDPAGVHVVDSAPFLSLPVEGDFVARLLVRPTFAATWDSGCLMVRHDALHWAKVCYERTDFGSHAVVSVVTDGRSDDANGPDLQVEQVWLQLARVGDCFGLHYALDGRSWRMVRYAALTAPARVRVGLVAQSPAGDGTTVEFPHFSVEARTLANLRLGE